MVLAAHQGYQGQYLSLLRGLEFACLRSLRPRKVQVFVQAAAYHSSCERLRAPPRQPGPPRRKEGFCKKRGGLRGWGGWGGGGGGVFVRFEALPEPPT